MMSLAPFSLLKVGDDVRGWRRSGHDSPDQMGTDRADPSTDHLLSSLHHCVATQSLDWVLTFLGTCHGCDHAKFPERKLVVITPL
jgi:hypothetical protein